MALRGFHGTSKRLTTMVRLVPQVFVELIPVSLNSDADGVADGPGIAAPVRNDAHSINAQKRRPPVFAVIDAAVHPSELLGQRGDEDQVEPTAPSLELRLHDIANRQG